MRSLKHVLVALALAGLLTVSTAAAPPAASAKPVTAPAVAQSDDRCWSAPGVHKFYYDGGCVHIIDTDSLAALSGASGAAVMAGLGLSGWGAVFVGTLLATGAENALENGQCMWVWSTTKDSWPDYNKFWFGSCSPPE